jgi:D-alanyl-D-alanine carboxypeptidase (penicillin-binding protein 5/6)
MNLIMRENHMKSVKLWFAAAALAIAAPVAAQAPAIPAPPQVAAKSWLVLDTASGQMLVENNIDARAEPASLTKMMTVHVVANELAAGRIKLEDMVTVSERAWRMEGSKMFIEVNKQVSVEDLLKGVIIQSGNDASVALAEHVSGSEEVFASMMNQEAQRLGLSGTHFVNSTGWPDPNHYTTARDMALLAAAMIREHPDLYVWHSIKEFTFNGIRQQNRNDLLWKDPSVDGVKTGHTETAGFCLVASAKRDGMRLVAVVMGTDGSEARIRATEALLNYAFRFYESHRLVAAGETLAAPKVWKGAAVSVPLGLREDLLLAIPRGSLPQVEKLTETHPDILAPIAEGDVLGTLKVRLGGRELASRPLVALAAVPPGSLFRRFMDEIFLILE